MSEHVDSVKTYAAVWILLLILTGVTTAVAYVDLGAFSVVAALAIAVVKMLLVALFFMHLRQSTQSDAAGGGGRAGLAADPAGAEFCGLPDARVDRGSRAVAGDQGWGDRSLMGASRIVGSAVGRGVSGRRAHSGSLCSLHP